MKLEKLTRQSTIEDLFEALTEIDSDSKKTLYYEIEPYSDELKVYHYDYDNDQQTDLLAYFEEKKIEITKNNIWKS